MEALIPDAQVSLEEAVALGAVDSLFYAQFFFQRTVRQRSPEIHRDMWRRLDSNSRLVSFMVFRGGAKTTIARLKLSKKIAYGLARTIVVVGKSQDHARRTVEWLMRQVEHNKLWAGTFGLKKGKKWTSEELEVKHEVEGLTIRCIALGITGSTRGINVDDYRPDFILIDDPCDEENTATQEQREKTDDFINGSLRNSLAPESEAPHAQMVFLQTLLHDDDSISRCDKDPAWASVRYSIFTEEGESVWPERWTTEQLKKEKASFAARGKLSLWMREMECQIVSSELAAFQPGQLNYYTILPETEEMQCFLAIDPVPPPSERELAKGLAGKDWEVLAVVGRWRNLQSGEMRYFLCEIAKNKGHSPDWTIAKLFELVDRWQVARVRVESVAYQRTLKWLIEQEMRRRRRYVQVDDTGGDRRKKSYRIIDMIGTAVQHRQLYVHESQTDFIEQYLAYPNVKNDDVIEAVAEALRAAMQAAPTLEEIRYLERSEDDPLEGELVEFGSCP